MVEEERGEPRDLPIESQFQSFDLSIANLRPFVARIGFHTDIRAYQCIALVSLGFE